MIKQLRRKFIMIAMSAVILVLAVIMGVILFLNYHNTVSNADATVALLLENDGTFPQRGGGKLEPKGDREAFEEPPSNGYFSEETPYETRFFTVSIDKNGETVSVNTGSIAAVSTEDAMTYAESIIADGESKGFISHYRFGVGDTDTGQCVVFVDCGKDLDLFWSFLKTCLGISCFGIVGVFLLVLILSSRAIKPVAESYEKQKHFITDAGHELKTPLAVIAANTDVLEMTQGENEWTGSIKNQVKRLSVLTDELVALSRMDENAGALLKTEFSLSDVVRETAEGFQLLAESQEKNFTFQVAEDISYCGNEDALGKLAGILMENAVKYTPQGGNIHIRLEKSGKNIILEEKNTTAGMTTGNLDRVFERFYRGDTSRSSEIGGYGIGLSIAKSIVAAHKGKIHAQSPDGKTFVLTVTL